jgi:hypothetical protein
MEIGATHVVGMGLQLGLGHWERGLHRRRQQGAEAGALQQHEQAWDST